MEINSLNSVYGQFVIDSVYGALNNKTLDNKVNLKETVEGVSIQGLASKDSFFHDIEKLNFEDRLARGAKTFRSVLNSALPETDRINDDETSAAEQAVPSDESSEGSSAGYFMTIPYSASEDNQAANMFNKISYLYDPSLRFSTGRLVNLLV